jgi:glycerol-3-phosphate dehydrogenase
MPPSTHFTWQLNVGPRAQLVGSVYLPHTELTGSSPSADGEIRSASCRGPPHFSDTGFAIRARQFVNAAGAWSMTCRTAGGLPDVHLLYAKGTLLVTTTG